VISATRSGEKSSREAANPSNPSHRSSMYAASWSPSFRITCIIPLRTGMLCPGSNWRKTLAWSASSIRRGSATTSLAPFWVTARFTRSPMIGWFSVVLEPMIRNAFAFSMSAMEFVIAPEPKLVARPAAVELCQSRAQWSTLLVPTTARKNFWKR